ncbi:acetyl/propionyl/methylcrotonyl-CoA carboxylase subunit alpha [Paroceanicella profunda]|uniref:Acetyl/propionyl/methylcrotonyl-CoA carboxylase subunit alpha n=1 Tax=Paroceanicella profunda TaxID=2579971 RepID=A0A5B8FSG7_9RHOB|nr:acetyl/propionyl/methylcrotonyl-CoA carboxylase subunit alpha [Paroceanicella profunda]QDL91325.1 acetyl/propionyl/methylcrotonyl-CoA carboxylase subunit alpha [Paroceanicella profunda]
MIRKILIANRGEIATRVIATARRLGIATVAVYSDADAAALHVEMADEALRLGPAPAAESYLRGDLVIAAAQASGADAIHPGYGFLSENPGFVEAVEAADLTFIGPSAAAIRAMGLKDAAKRLMEEAGVPVVPGYHGERQEPEFLAAEAARIGFPVLVKARAGGGGKGMRRVDRPEDFTAALLSAQREAQAAFGDPAVLIEKYVTAPRHIEIQVFGDSHGNAVHLGERDCSLQRRHQKVIEEAPAPGMTPQMREAMGAAAVRAAQAIGYSGAGTIEFIVDGSDGLRADRFWFMEMNTRLQVEHPVTEAVTGLDLVEWQIRVASGEALPLRQAEITLTGHAFEARLYAEDAGRGFLPATGRLAHLRFPPGIRADTGVRTGDEISPWYDPMIAKLVTHGPTREAALSALARALDETEVAGTVTNIAFLAALARHEGFAAGAVDTGLIDRDLAALLPGEGPPAPWLLALAALGAAGLDSPAPRQGFTLWAPLRRSLTLGVDGAPVRAIIEVRGPGLFTVEIGAERLAIALHARGAEIDGRHRAARILRHGAGVSVWSGGQACHATLTDPLTAAAEAGPGGDMVLAPMPGLVKHVGVTAGAAVGKGQPLAILEAMKMEHTLTAPRDGTIAEVLVAEGDQVTDGALLLRLEAEA